MKVGNGNEVFNAFFAEFALRHRGLDDVTTLGWNRSVFHRGTRRINAIGEIQIFLVESGEHARIGGAIGQVDFSISRADEITAEALAARSERIHWHAAFGARRIVRVAARSFGGQPRVSLQ